MILQWILSSCVLLAAVVLLGGILGERISGKLRYAMWLVVLLRLLIPVQLFSYEAPMLTDERTPQVVTAERGFVVPAEQIGAEEADELELTQLLGTVWIAGSVVVGVVFLVSNLSFGRRLKKARIKTGIEYRVPVYLIGELNSPCLFGLLRPAIYVPAKMEGDRRGLHHMLAHECAHFGQGDHIWSALRCVVLAVHWWNPLVWWAVTLSKRDGELACDEGALQDLWYDQRRAYGETLLSLVTAPVQPASIFSCAITMTAEKRNLKQRIRRIANRKGYYMSASVITVLVMVLLAVCSFTGPEAYAAGNVGGLDYELLGALPYRPDLDHDGREDVLTLSYAKTESGSRSYLLEVRKDGEVLWSASADTDQAGWNALFLTEVGGEDYLLRVESKLSEGRCAYGYSLSYLNEYGGRHIYDRQYLLFDISFNSERQEGAGLFDPAAIAFVADKINGYLAGSCQLLNTDENLLASFARGGTLVDDLWWLDEIDGFTRDEELTLKENLWACFDQCVGGEPEPYFALQPVNKHPSLRAKAVIDVMLTAPNPDLQYVVGGSGVDNDWATRRNRQVTRNWDAALRRYIAWDNWQGPREDSEGYVYDKDRRVIYYQLNRFQVEAAASGDVYEVLDIEVLSREEGREELDVAYAVNGEERHVKMTFYGALLFTWIDIEPME